MRLEHPSILCAQAAGFRTWEEKNSLNLRLSNISECASGDKKARSDLGLGAKQEHGGTTEYLSASVSVICVPSSLYPVVS